MKNIKKVLAVLIALTVLFSLSVSVFAASITIEGGNADETYTAYKLFDATIGTAAAEGEDPPVSYTIAKTISDAENPVWTTIIGEATADSNGVYTAQGLTFTPSAGDANVYVVAATDSFDAAAFAAFLNNNKTTLGTGITSSGTTITVTEKGYYFVDTTLGSLCSLVTPETTQKLYEKNSIPTLTKEVQEDSDSTWGASAHGDMGQTMNFRLTVNTGTNSNAPTPASGSTPATLNGVDANYVITDTLPAGMTYTGDTFATTEGASKVSGVDSAASVAISGWTLGTDFWATYSEDVLTITLGAAKVASLGQNADIIITYGARIDTDAVVGGNGNVNTAYLEYQHQKTTNATTTVYTYEFSIEKVDKANNSTKLKDVEFVLKDASGNYFIASASNASVWQATENKIKTSTDGTITFTGLDAGTYTLTEVATNDGYNLLDTDVTVTIAADGTVSMSGAKSVSDGKIVIENAKGAVLPSTGGIGTTIFYVLGTILVFGCGIILVAKKRAKAMDK